MRELRNTPRGLEPCSRLRRIAFGGFATGVRPSQSGFLGRRAAARSQSPALRRPVHGVATLRASIGTFGPAWPAVGTASRSILQCAAGRNPGSSGLAAGVGGLQPEVGGLQPRVGGLLPGVGKLIKCRHESPPDRRTSDFWTLRTGRSSRIPAPSPSKAAGKPPMSQENQRGPGLESSEASRQLFVNRPAGVRTHFSALPRRLKTFTARNERREHRCQPAEAESQVSEPGSIAW